MQVKTLRTFKSVTSFLKGYFKNNLNEYIILKKKKIGRKQPNSVRQLSFN